MRADTGASSSGDKAAAKSTGVGDADLASGGGAGLELGAAEGRWGGVLWWCGGDGGIGGGGGGGGGGG